MKEKERATKLEEKAKRSTLKAEKRQELMQAAKEAAEKKAQQERLEADERDETDPEILQMLKDIEEDIVETRMEEHEMGLEIPDDPAQIAAQELETIKHYLETIPHESRKRNAHGVIIATLADRFDAHYELKLQEQTEEAQKFYTEMIAEPDGDTSLEAYIEIHQSFDETTAHELSEAYEHMLRDAKDRMLELYPDYEFNAPKWKPLKLSAQVPFLKQMQQKFETNDYKAQHEEVAPASAHITDKHLEILRKSIFKVVKADMKTKAKVDDDKWVQSLVDAAGGKPKNVLTHVTTMLRTVRKIACKWKQWCAHTLLSTTPRPTLASQLIRW